MAKKAKSGISGSFNWRVPPTIVPSFVQGKDAKALYDKVKETIKDGLWYNDGVMEGSSTFSSARTDSELRPLGIRVATLADLSNSEVMEIIKGRHYSDTPAIVFRSMEDCYEPNKILIKTFAPLVEQKAGKLEFPCLVTGFDVVPSEDKGYGLEIVARDDFAVRKDERLAGKYHGSNFSDVDEFGLPKFDKKGSRTWYARDEGLSRLYLYRDLILVSYIGDLSYSDDIGRVVLVRDEVAGVENLAKLYEQRRSELSKRARKAEAVLERGYKEALDALAK